MLRISNPKRNRTAKLNLKQAFAQQIRYDASGRAYETIQVYNGTGGALVAGQPYLLRYASGAAINPYCITVAASGAAVVERVVFATAATPAATYGEMVIAGTYTIKVNGTTDVAAGDYLQLVVGTTTALVKDGGFATTSCAIALAASTANSDNDTLCFIIPERCSIDQT